MGKVNKQQLVDYLKTISFNYFSDLIGKERNVRIEPNFEREGRKALIFFHKNGFEFNIQKNENVEAQIKKITLFKGLRVNRNDNYSTDSYDIKNQEEGFTVYKLFEK